MKFLFLQCPQCGNNDKNLFSVQEDENIDEKFVCKNCGVLDIIPVELALDPCASKPEYRYLLDWAAIDPPPPDLSHTGDKTYTRESHLLERIRQYLNREPKIPPEDVEVILEFAPIYAKVNLIFANYTPPPDDSRGIPFSLTKTDIRGFLRFINKKTHTKKFTNLYLEKWKSVKKILQPHIPPDYMTEEQLRVVIAKFRLYSAIWNDLNREKVVKGRSHFPNFNYVLTKIFEEEKIPVPKGEFPTPKTSLSELEFYYSLIKQRFQRLGRHDPETRQKKRQKTIQDFFGTSDSNEDGDQPGRLSSSGETPGSAEECSPELESRDSTRNPEEISPGDTFTFRCDFTGDELSEIFGSSHELA